MALKGTDSLSEIFKTLGVREECEGSRSSKEGRGGKKERKSEKTEKKKGEPERRVRSKETAEREDLETVKEKMEKMFYWQRLPGMVEEMSPDERAQWDTDLHQLSYLMEKCDFKNQKDKNKLYELFILRQPHALYSKPSITRQKF